MKGLILDKKNIIVTGGAGFIGSHLCDELVKKHNVICLDNFISGSEHNIDHLLKNPNFEFIKYDLSQPLDLNKLPELKKFEVEFQGIQEIYHLAAPTSPNDYNRFPIETIVTNGLGTKNALDWAVKYQARFLLTSTSAIYGEPLGENLYFREDYWGFINPLGIRSCHQEGKRYAESLVVNYQREHKLNTKIVRVFTTYGPRMRLTDGRVVPDLIKEAINDETMIAYGQPDDLYSFCYIKDLIEGLVKIMATEQLAVVNLGSPYKVTLSELAQLIKVIAGAKSEIKYEKPLPYFIMVGLPDITKIKETLGWFPVTTLEQGLKETIDAMKAEKIIGLRTR